MGLFVETFGTETVDPSKIQSAIIEVFDLRPAALIRDLDLLRRSTRRPPPTAASAARTSISVGTHRPGVADLATFLWGVSRAHRRDGSIPTGHLMVCPGSLSGRKGHASTVPLSFLVDEL